MTANHGSLKKRILGLTVVAATVGALVAGIAFDSATPVKAYKTTYKGISELVDNHTMTHTNAVAPFVILEIVGDKSDASIGYLVGGEEPISEGKSLKDMPSNEERTEKMSAFSTGEKPSKLTGLVEAGALIDETDKYSEVTSGDRYFSIRGTFVEDANGKYYPKDPALTFVPLQDSSDEYNRSLYGNINRIYGDLNTRGLVLYNRVVEFSPSYGSGFDITLGRIPDDHIMPTFIEGSTDAKNDTYSGQYFEVEPISSGTKLYEGALIFTGSADSLTYYGRVIDTAEDDVVEDEPGVDETEPGNDESGEGETTGDGSTEEGSGEEEDATGDGTEGSGDAEPGEGNEDGEGGTGEGNDEGGAGENGDAGTDEGGDSGNSGSGSSGSTPKYEICVQEAGGNKVSLGSVRGDSFYRVVETNNADFMGEYYMITSYSSSSSGVFGRSYGFKAVSGSEYGEFNAPEGRTYFLNEMGSDNYAYTNDPSKGTHSFVADYSQSVYQNVQYKGGFTNNEWFKQYVLDRTETNEFEETSVDVITVTPDELTDELVAKAGLIYINTKNSTTDLNGDTALSILRKVYDGDVAIMMEYSSLSDDVESVINTNGNGAMMNKLLVMLMQDIAISSVPSDLNSPDLEWDKLIDGLYPGMPLDGGIDRSNVYKRIFVNDDTYANSAGVTNSSIISGDFFTVYDPDKVYNGFYDIITFNEKEESKIRYLFNDSGWDSFNKEISKATSIRYIINAKRSYNDTKGELHILDLEPYQSGHFTDEDLAAYRLYTASEIRGIIDSTIELEKLLNPGLDETKRREELENHFKNAKKSYYIDEATKDKLTRSWFINNVGIDYDSNPDSISIVEMGTHEFVGRNDNLNETYDMIYIGMDTSIMNTDVDYNYGEKLGTTYYMDSSMNGLVYTHVGDNVPINAASNKYADRGPIGDYRTTGTDITLDKFNALKKYIETGYAVLLSDDFFLNEVNGQMTINTNKVDVSSYMYKLISEVVLAKDGDVYKYYGKNVNRRSAFVSSTNGYQENREIFNNYLNISKLVVNAISVPQPWADGDSEQGKYLNRGDDGYYHLEYVVDLSSGTSIVDSSDTYTCKLYIDEDNDGKFEDASLASGTGEEVGVSITDESGAYISPNALRIGKTYTIQATLDEEFVGFLSWRLIFVQNESDEATSGYYSKDVRVSLSGFCAVRAGDNKPEIKILQIYSPTSRGNTLNLKNPDIQAKFAEVQDFNITVDLINMRDFVDKSTVVHNEGDVDNGDPYDASGMSYIEFLNQYDMLVLGFTDNYRMYGGNDADKFEAIKAFREYTLSGKSVLFTHDLTSVEIESKELGKDAIWFNLYMRDVLGQDRYGITSQNLNKDGITEDKYKYYSNYDNAILKNNSVDTMGFTDVNLMRYISWNEEIGYLFPYDKKIWNQKFSDTNKDIVTMINEGQVTQYPFIVTTPKEPTFMVSPTHPQVYQLNLDTDSADANTNDDIVVWYTLGNANNSDPGGANVGNLLQAVPNDARNNYYIYSRGNVFYTGAGHRAVTEDTEQKLFVNTLVAAYRSGTQSARVAFLERPDDSASEVKSVYMPYDPNMVVEGQETTGDFLLGDLKVNFKPINNSIKDSTLPINIKYYVEGTASDYTYKYDETYYKEIQPKSLDLVFNNMSEPWGDKNKVNNYYVYQAKFNNSDFMQGASNIKNNEYTKIFLRVGTNELSNEATAPGESMNALTIYSTKLFDLE